MSGAGGLDRFASRLHPDVVADIASWEDDPELGALRAALTMHEKPKRFFDTYAEALVARHLRARGCDLRLEVPTPHGKACDFEVVTGDHKFYLHVKRLATDRPGERKLTISSRLRYLERIARPYVVSVRWHEGTTAKELERLVRSASDFIQHAHVGDELVVHDDDGKEIGGVLIAAPYDGTHVSLAIGLPSGFIDEARRMRRLLRRAYKQFMPREVNAILICSSHDDDAEDFESALLGAHIERWDAFPPHGRRVAHGRAADGLWNENRYVESSAAGWFRLADGESTLRVKMHYRPAPALTPALHETMMRLFGE